MARLSLCILGAIQATLVGKPITGFRSANVDKLLILLYNVLRSWDLNGTGYTTLIMIWQVHCLMA